MSEATPLDEAWAEINALGGYVAPDDERAQGYSDALNDALAILERLGARDPLRICLDEIEEHDKQESEAA